MQAQPDNPRGLNTTLFGIGAAVWIICAIKPWDYEAWMLEQLASVAALLVLAWCWRRGIRFSTGSKICITLMLVAHTIGTHFTYSETPYDAFTREWLGFSVNELFGWDRNNYDRLVHLLYGILLALPVAEALQQRMGLNRLRAYFFGTHLIISTSAIYELVEWVAALIFGADLGNHYLGSQGDIWDAQADIALAIAGCLGVYLLAALSVPARKIQSMRSMK